MHFNLSWGIPAFLILFGCVFVVLGVFVAQSGRNWLRAPGVVVDLQRQWSGNSVGESSSGGYIYYPIVRFQTPDGQEVETKSDVGSRPAPARRGASVRVMYDPQNPYRARVDNLLGNGGCVGVAFVVVGALVAAGGVFALVVVPRML